jgi:hypothetical protein
MTILPRLYEIYRSAGLVPLTGHSTSHMHNWRDAPFTRFFDGQGLVGCAGLSLFEIMFVEHLRDYLQPRAILVIGNAHGWSTLALALTFPAARIVAIDPDQVGIDLTNRLAEQNGLNVRAIATTSPHGVGPACAADLPGPADFVLIDAVHTNEAIITDFTAAAAVADPQAAYLFHDVVNWRMVEGVKRIQQQSGLQGRLLTRTPSGMALLHREIAPEFAAYLDCFTDNPQLLANYRSLIGRSVDADPLGEALAAL